MSKELGTLVVVVLKARNLPDKHSFFKQDVYTKVTLGETTKQTGIDVKGGQHPVWDEELRFEVFEQSKKSAKTLELSCWSKEPRLDDVVGKGELDITETLQSGEFDVNGVQRGELYLEMTFFAAGPPPALSRRPSKMTQSDRLAPPKQSSPPRTNDHHGSVSSTSPARTHLLLPTDPHRGRLSPKPSESPLPPLPDEPVVTPATVPAILRPGAGRLTSPSPPDAARNTPLPHTPPRSISGDRSNAATPRIHHSPGYVPPNLRPGPVNGASPTPRPSSYVAEADIPSLPVSTLGYTSPVPAPVSLTTVYPTYHSPHIDQQRPIPALPANPQPTSWHSPPPSHPNLQPSTYSVDPSSSPIPGFAFPTPHVPVRQQGSYPSTYPANYPSHPQAFSPPSRPYPYNYAPPPRDPDLDLPDPHMVARYRKPLPLPDEPEGMQTPTVAHPQSHVSLAAVSSRPHDPATRTHTDVAPTSHRQSLHERDEERDRLLALAFEHEEDERRKRAEEQEEIDRQLARRLDLELNLTEEESGGRDEMVLNGTQTPGSMPGGWYRHRVDV
ncbi:hypothetical protein PHLCEN_2v7172 [Hermanssonia centrifuga]|uniref:C2 domain-containing protein n=1 Tax=Hermanssonia centrifuga TaxID=98765 RepID=A0A2R6NX79_9APHY|nr:hypothetical protein PHLCEN_2v7172 [Hermanssonia centrifuga]